MRVVWLVVGVLLIVSCLVLAAIGGRIAAYSNARATETAAAPTVASTSIALQTIHTPTLGGTLDDFQQRYGAPLDGSTLMYGATIAGQRVLIILTLADASQTTDGEPHVAVIAVQVPGEALGHDTWSQSTADTIARTFLPSDAQFQRIATPHNSVTGATIHDHIYTSASMALTFNPDQFTNDMGTVAVPVGTISYSCHPWPPAAPGLGQCLITIGSY